MKVDDFKVTIGGLDDKKGFYDLLAEIQVKAAMEMCQPELRMQVLDNALAILKGEKEVLTK
ncbi:hypothetical protein DVW07_10760 [Clostridium botulinum]|uniref:hypothetical protein n=1 Tax=Clostridium botulinum TaxID=1491 RepID=UPI000A170430|nr:hypothetical protein [Clostridium botulinum]MBN1042539.1 hypothetical protein [Clostridium botulinum]